MIDSKEVEERRAEDRKKQANKMVVLFTTIFAKTLQHRGSSSAELDSYVSQRCVISCDNLMREVLRTLPSVYLLRQTTADRNAPPRKNFPLEFFTDMS